MAVARFGLGTLPSVDRVALAARFPTARGGVSVLLDVGANVDSKVAHLEQFAIMGEIYYRAIFGTRRPKVALLSIGEEEMKGNELTREAYNRLKQLPINFIGNVEGRDVFAGNVDVIVCDGFIGNVALKISEGVAQLIITMLKNALQSTLSAQVGSLLSRRAFRDFKKKIDYSEYGGAPLLGVRGVAVISHGSSNANAMKNAIRVAAGLARAKTNEKIEQELSAVAAAARPLAPAGKSSRVWIVLWAKWHFCFPGRRRNTPGWARNSRRNSPPPVLSSRRLTRRWGFRSRSCVLKVQKTR